MEFGAIGENQGDGVQLYVLQDVSYALQCLVKIDVLGATKFWAMKVNRYPGLSRIALRCAFCLFQSHLVRANVTSASSPILLRHSVRG